MQVGGVKQAAQNCFSGLGGVLLHHRLRVLRPRAAVQRQFVLSTDVEEAQLRKLPHALALVAQWRWVAPHGRCTHARRVQQRLCEPRREPCPRPYSSDSPINTS